MSPKRLTYKNWAGISIVGTVDWAPPTKSTEHMERAAWLTAAIETGAKFGTVQSYDGAAMSAGIEHKIAIYPRSMEQGSLWSLLQKLPAASPAVNNLLSAIKQVGWYIDPRGIVRKTATGAAVSAAEIREEFTPKAGVVPTSGANYDKAVRWAQLWSAAFADPATHRPQIEEAKRSLLLSHKALESRAYKAFANLDDGSAGTTTNLSEHLDLAMCFYHSFSVNAPTKARKCLEEALTDAPEEKYFCRKLIRLLGTSTYGNWKQRYTRTRASALKSGLWTASVVDEFAPAKL
jgi:hypothetical protein